MVWKILNPEPSLSYCTRWQINHKDGEHGFFAPPGLLSQAMKADIFIFLLFDFLQTAGHCLNLTKPRWKEMMFNVCSLFLNSASEGERKITYPPRVIVWLCVHFWKLEERPAAPQPPIFSSGREWGVMEKKNPGKAFNMPVESCHVNPQWLTCDFSPEEWKKASLASCHFDLFLLFSNIYKKRKPLNRIKSGKV